MSTVIAFSSGKSGVGTTTIATNIGLSLVARNAKVCLFNTDVSSENTNQLMGITPQFTLQHVLNGQKDIDEIIVELSSGMSVVSAISGINEGLHLYDKQMPLYTHALERLEKKFDYILIDTTTGFSSFTLDYICSAHYRVIVITSDPGSLTDSFKLLKLLIAKGTNESIFILINRVDSYQISQTIFRSFKKTVKTYLHIDVHYLGYLTNDECVNLALSQHVSVVLSYPNSSVSCSLASLADIMKRQFISDQESVSFSHYWKNVQLTNTNKPKSNKSSYLNSFGAQQHSEQQLKDLILTLEIIYERKHKQSSRDLNSSIALILAEGDENRMQHLHGAIERSFERQFEKKITNPVETIQALMNDQAFSKNDFNHLLESFAIIYQQRFNEKHFAEGNTLLAQIQRLLASQNG